MKAGAICTLQFEPNTDGPVAGALKYIPLLASPREDVLAL
jgi:hypothetical protein